MKKLLFALLLLTAMIGCVPAHSQVTQQQLDAFKGTATGTNTYAVTITQITASAPYDGQKIWVKFNNANTGASTLAVTVAGSVTYPARAITLNGSALVSGDIVINQYIGLVYYLAGTSWQMTRPGAGASTVTSVTGSGNIASSGGTTPNITFTGTLPIANGGTNNSTAYTAGSVIFSDGTKLTEDNANFFWDDANNRLGLRTTAPNHSLDAAFSSTSALGTAFPLVAGRNTNAVLGDGATTFNYGGVGMAAGNGVVSGSLISSYTNNGGSGFEESVILSSTTVHPIRFITQAGVAPKYAMKINATDGFVGVGGYTSTAAGIAVASLDVRGSSGTTIRIQDGNQGAGKVLTSDADGDGTWTVPAAAGLTVGSTSIASGTVGAVLFEGAGNVLQEDATQFFWDNTNNRLGIGTASPSSRITIGSSAASQGLRITPFAGSGDISLQYSSNNSGVLFLTATAAVGYTNLYSDRADGINVEVKASIDQNRPYFQARTADNDIAIQLYDNSGAASSLYLFEPGVAAEKISLRSNGYHSWINTGQNFCIGTDGAGSAKLHVVGAGATSATYGLQVHNSTGTNNALVVRNDGVVGVGTSAPTATLDVLENTIGNAVLNISSTTTGENSNPTYYFAQGNVATTTTVTATLQTITPPVTSITFIEATVIGASNSVPPSEGAAYVIRGSYRKSDAGVITLVTSGLVADYTAEDDATWNATLTISGANILVQVTGDATPIQWNSTTKVTYTTLGVF